APATSSTSAAAGWRFLVRRARGQRTEDSEQRPIPGCPWYTCPVEQRRIAVLCPLSSDLYEPRPPLRPAGARPDARPGRAVLHDGARRTRRPRHQGREPRRRRRLAPLRALLPAALRVLHVAQPRQGERRAGLQE